MVDSTAQPKRSVGRPRERVLTRARIIAVALEVMDARGEVSVRQVAQRLGVRPSSLYNHVDGHADLLAGIRELLTDRIPTACFRELAWDEALVVWAEAYRETFAAHPAALTRLVTTPLQSGSRSSVMYEEVVAGLVRGGWPCELALTVVVAVEDLIVGAALDAGAASTMLNPNTDGEFPAFEAAYAQREAALARTGCVAADAAFQLGLSALIDGLRVELVRLRAGLPVLRIGRQFSSADVAELLDDDKT